MTTTTTTNTPRERLGLPPRGSLHPQQIRSAWRQAVRAVPASLAATAAEQQARDQALAAIHRARALLECREVDEATRVDLATEYQQRVADFVGELVRRRYDQYGRWAVVPLAAEDAMPRPPRVGSYVARPPVDLINAEASADDVRWVSSFELADDRAWVVLELTDGTYRAIVFWMPQQLTATAPRKKKPPPRVTRPTITTTTSAVAKMASPKTAAPPPRSRPADPPPPPLRASRAERRAYYEGLRGDGDVISALRAYVRS